MLEGLSPRQNELVDAWIPGCEAVANLSWGLVDTTVLHVRHGGRDLIVKAEGPRGHHLGRELDAHLGGYVDALTDSGHAAHLLFHDRGDRVFVRTLLPGVLAFRTPAATDPEVHRRAGALLRTLHSQGRRDSEGADAAATRRAIAWLDGDHRIDATVEARLRSVLARLEGVEEPLVPTHGDWHPRNWLIDGDEVRVIDFGRFAFRTAASDFVRLAAQEWHDAPECEASFLEGYGGDPRQPGAWALLRVREAIGTAAWAHQVGDRDFEAQGHRMIAEALADVDN